MGIHLNEARIFEFAEERKEIPSGGYLFSAVDWFSLGPPSKVVIQIIECCSFSGCQTQQVRPDGQSQRSCIRIPPEWKIDAYIWSLASSYILRPVCPPRRTLKNYSFPIRLQALVRRFAHQHPTFS